MTRVGTGSTAGQKSEQIRSYIENKDRKGERSIAVAQAGIASFLLCLHIITGLKNGWHSINEWVILCLIVINIFSIARYQATRRRKVHPGFFNTLTVFDGLVFLGLIMTYSVAYDIPMVSNLKATSVVFLFVFIALRALKTDPLSVIVAGLTVALGWALQVLYLIAVSDDLIITKSYSEYLISHSLLIGAEVEKIVGFLTLTIIIGLGVARARKLLIDSAQIGDLIKERDMIKKLASTDTLTGLVNREEFRRRLDQALAVVGLSSSQPALMLIDLDEFKSINDTRGHPAGDKVLKVVGQRLAELFGSKDVVARLGGDEFAIIVSDYQSRENLEALSLKIRSEINKTILPRTLNAVVDTSIGIAIAPTDWVTADYLMSNADIALYESKRLGRGKFTFYREDFRQKIREDKKVENELKIALKHNQLKVVYQPKVCLRTNRINSVEALIRWDHPIMGMLGPGYFLPVAEQSSLINEIGRVVLENVCELILRCRREGLEIDRFAINVAAREFMADNNYFDNLMSTLSQRQIPANKIELEITEQVLLDKRTESVFDTFMNLREKGVYISLDDFGTGYASLMHLSKCPIHAIKLDKSFISGINKNKEDTAIVSSITRMAKEMALDVTAEGVETLEQFDFVRNAGCDFVQGYYIAKPLSEDALIEFVYDNVTTRMRAVG